MNNSRIVIDNASVEEEFDRAPVLREREAELVKIIEAIKGVISSEEWSSLKNLVWDGVVETLERQQKSEASKEEINTLALSKINGQLVWAKKYADLESLANVFRLELTNIRQILYGKTPKDSGIN